MKLIPVLVLCLCLLCGSAAAFADSAPAFPDLPDKLPDEYRQPLAENAGTVKRITYPSRDYAGDGAAVTKPALVYLPAGYSEDQQYDLLVLCHGIGGNEREWGFLNAAGTGRSIVDRLIADGETRPLIIVMPNGRSSADYASSDIWGVMQTFYSFGQELRNDLLPWMDAHYATYGSLTPDDLSAARDHRFMAGLSMGGMQTINIGLCECLDLFSAFGAFSAAPTSYPASKVASLIKSFDAYPIRMFYSICGTGDGTAYASASQAAKKLPDYTDRLTEANWIWQECPGDHNFDIWYLGLYNFLRLLGR